MERLVRVRYLKSTVNLIKEKFPNKECGIDLMHELEEIEKLAECSEFDESQERLNNVLCEVINNMDSLNYE
ncbi:hypothetical protein CON64_22730 [Bacillus pseudomycoides]|nr:hypothetical protein CON64_22730 [Bacillus pseudomycoides]